MKRNEMQIIVKTIENLLMMVLRKTSFENA
jgi:hypothetical protein